MRGPDRVASSGGECDGPVSVAHLSKWFGARTAFADVTFEVGHGEVFGFLGPNGAGKTTMVRTLGTSSHPPRAPQRSRHTAQCGERCGDPPTDLDHARGARPVPAPQRDREPPVLR